MHALCSNGVLTQGKRRHRGVRGGECGASLVEVMVALVVLAVALLGTGSFFVYAFGQMEELKTKRIALELASAELDRMLAVDYSDVVSGTQSGVTLGDYTATVTTVVTERSAGSPAYDYREVVVTVSWQKQGRALEVVLSTIVGKKWSD